MTLGRTSDNKIKIKTDGGLRAVECGCCGPLSNCCSLTENGLGTGQYSASYLPHSFKITWKVIDYEKVYGDDGLVCPVPYLLKTSTWTRSGTTYNRTSGDGGDGIFSFFLEDWSWDGFPNFTWLTDNVDGGGFSGSGCFNGPQEPQYEWAKWDFNNTNCDNFQFSANGYNWGIEFYNADGSVWQYPSFPLPGWPTSVNFEWCTNLNSLPTGCSCGGQITSTVLTSTNGVVYTGTGSHAYFGEYSVQVVCKSGWTAKVTITAPGSFGVAAVREAGVRYEDLAYNWPLGCYDLGTEYVPPTWQPRNWGGIRIS